MAINFFQEDTTFKLPNRLKIKKWIKQVAADEGYMIMDLNYIFCSDEYLYQINFEYLNHTTYTYIITFDNSEDKKKLEGDIFGIGDGYSDFQLKESGLIQKFYAFTENIARQSILEKADHVTPSFDEFLYINQLPRAISYPKNRILCLIVGDVPEETMQILKKDGFSIRHKTSFEEKYVADVGMLILANGEKIEDEQLKQAVKLKTIGYLGNSKQKLSHKIATEMGIVIFDDPKHNPRNAQFISKRVADFINRGDTYLSSNFPNLQLPKVAHAHRLIHIHKNVPGIMAQINQIFANHKINIVSQFLMTNSHIGYAITDVSDQYDKQVLKELKEISNTIKFRILY